MELPGLDSLVETCRARNLSLLLASPGEPPPRPGTLIAGHPLDPVLAAIYARLESATFALERDGLFIHPVNGLERSNASFQEYPQPELEMPVFAFGGITALAYTYATVPGLADARGHQPVVEVDGHEAPYAVPVASDVDWFLGSYASYLQALVSHPEYRPEAPAPILFPWDVPDILARDERLVAMLRAGRFDPFLHKYDLRDWASTLLRLADSPLPRP